MRFGAASLWRGQVGPVNEACPNINDQADRALRQWQDQVCFDVKMLDSSMENHDSSLENHDFCGIRTGRATRRCCTRRMRTVDCHSCGWSLSSCQ